MSKEVKLPSGADLIIQSAPFGAAKALYQSVLEEVKSVNTNPEIELDTNFLKDLACVLFSSKKVESALWECMKRATYNGMKIVPDTFEDEKAREDYVSVCVEVAEVNLRPFMKGLSAELSQVGERVGSFQQPK